MAEGEVVAPGVAEIVEAPAPAGAPEWMGGLPDDLKGDATLSRFADPTALARGFIETQKLARSKLAVPAADAAPEEWGKVFEALGRPKAPDGYAFEAPAAPDGANDEVKAAHLKAFEEATAPFKAVAHEIGLLPGQAQKLLAFDQQRIAAAQEAYYAEGAKEVDALKAELKANGVDYDTEKAAAKSVFLKVFGEEAAEMADALDQKVGSGRLLRGMMKLAKLTGEHGRIDGLDEPGFAAGDANAEAQLTELFKDSGWRAKYNAGDAATVAQEKRLRAAAMNQALKRRG